jgi:antitoxin ChpS
MSIVSIRRQGGAAVLTIPASVMQALKADIGTEVSVEVVDGALIARPRTITTRKRYSLRELLRGATPSAIRKLNAETAWAREGKPVGREI